MTNPDDGEKKPDDYVVQLRVKNNRMLSYMRAMGFKSASQLARASGVDPCRVGLLINLKIPAMTKAENWRASVIRICEALRCLPEDIIPEQHWRQGLKKNTAEITVDADELEYLIATHQAVPSLPDADLMRHNAEKEIGKALMKLTPRVERVLQLRFFHERTLEETATEMGVSRERIRQMEARAFRTLSKNRRLRQIFEDGDCR